MKKERIVPSELENTESILMKKLVDEVKLNIIRNILNDIHDYDNRFDVPHIMHISDIVKHIQETEISEIFCIDLIDDLRK
jgi:hypothetical protein